MWWVLIQIKDDGLNILWGRSFSRSQIVKWLFSSLHPILIHRIPRHPFLLEDERAPSDLASQVTISESLLKTWRCEVLEPCSIAGFHLNFPHVLLQIFYRVRNWLSSELLKITSLHIAISEDLWIASKTCIWIELWSNFRSNELIKVYWWAEGEEKISFLDWWCFVNYPCYPDPSWLRIRPKINREDYERYAASANEHWYWTIISYTYRSYGSVNANSTHKI